MPAETPVQAHGVLLEVNDGASDAFAAVAVVSNLTPPGHTIKAIERKRLVNPGLVEHIPAKRVDPGDFTFQFEITDVLFARLEALKGVSKSYRCTYADGLRLAWTGFIMSNKPDAMGDADEIAMGTTTAKCTSLIAVTDV